ncbi:hypothetical protein BJ508DRAFT_170155 [Ascobolus immersus RN42]|uniref:VIT-domain-containing protein n=1 Tax=Ascobolus immersus RN42 TaxID=1160509 RepID=A0A3N4HW52_ASCIM|nr:hypothetical protein BJ508DRAFT_170155 [Ascobolus immersus RN42]
MSQSSIFTPSNSGSETDSNSGISFYLDDVDPYTSDTSNTTDDDGWYKRDDGKGWLPRLKTEAKATVISTSTHLTLIQTFENPSRYRPIRNATYSFPLYPHATVVALECNFRDKKLVGRVEPKPKARKIYAEAVNSGQAAALLEEATPEIFTVELGNIAPMEKVEVSIRIISEIKHDPDHDSVRFVLPTAIASRYGAMPSGISTNQYVAASLEIEVGIMMPEEIRAITAPNQPMTIIYGELPGETKKKDSNPTDAKKATVRLVKESEGALAADFVLMIQVKKFSKSMPPFALIEQHPHKPGSMALMVSLVPRASLPLPEVKPEIIFIVDLSGSMRSKILKLRSALEVFLKSLPIGVFFNICFFGNEQRLLFSASREYSEESLGIALEQTRAVEADMGGTKLLGAVRTALSSKSEGQRPTEVIVLTDGEVWQSEEIFDFIRQRRKQDAGSGNHLRVFALGIGDQVSYHLVEGMAEAGGGFSCFVGNNEAFGDKIVRMLKAALAVKITDLEVEVEFEDGHGYLPAATIATIPIEATEVDPPKKDINTSSLWTTKKDKKAITLMDSDSDSADEEESIKPAVPFEFIDDSPRNQFSHLKDIVPPNPLRSPNSLEHVFPHQRTVLFLLFQQDSKAPISAARNVSIKTRLSSGEELPPLLIPITSVEFPENLGSSTMIHCLAARNIIKDMQQGRSWLETGSYGITRESALFEEYVTREAERLGMEFGIVSKWTSFVAVELEPVLLAPSRISEVTDEDDNLGIRGHSNVADSGKTEQVATSDISATTGSRPKDEVFPTGTSSAPNAYGVVPDEILSKNVQAGQFVKRELASDTRRDELPVVVDREVASTPLYSNSLPFSGPALSIESGMLSLNAGGPASFRVKGTYKICGASTDGLDYTRRPGPSRRPGRASMAGGGFSTSRLYPARSRMATIEAKFTPSSSSLLERLPIANVAPSFAPRRAVSRVPLPPADMTPTEPDGLSNEESGLSGYPIARMQNCSRSRQQQQQSQQLRAPAPQSLSHGTLEQPERTDTLLEKLRSRPRATRRPSPERNELESLEYFKNVAVEDGQERGVVLNSAKIPRVRPPPSNSPGDPAFDMSRLEMETASGAVGWDAPDSWSIQRPSMNTSRDDNSAAHAHHDELMKKVAADNYSVTSSTVEKKQTANGDNSRQSRGPSIENNRPAPVPTVPLQDVKPLVLSEKRWTPRSYQPSQTPVQGAPAKSDNKAELVEYIISLQAFNGAFRLTETDVTNLQDFVLRATGKPLELMGDPVADTERIVSVLVDCCAKWESTWTLVVEKARAWLSSA